MRKKYLLLLGLVFVIGIAIVAYGLQQSSDFDTAFNEGKIKIEGESIDYGETKHPIKTDFSEAIPWAQVHVYHVPRSFYSSGQFYLEIPAATKLLYAAVIEGDPNMITITMPATADGRVMVESRIETSIILWVEK